MRAIIIIAATSLWLAALPATAQEAPDRRAELAERLVALSEGSNLTKEIDSMVKEQLAALPDIPPAEAEWMRANMPRMVMGMVEQMMPELTALYGEIFTEAELEAQIALFEGPHGPSIADKSVELGMRQAELMQQAQLAFIEELVTKYCAAFDCAGQAAAAAKSQGRR